MCTQGRQLAKTKQKPDPNFLFQQIGSRTETYDLGIHIPVLCNCLYGLVSLYKNYLCLYFVRGLVYVSSVSLINCKKWQQTYFYCAYNL